MEYMISRVLQVVVVFSLPILLLVSLSKNMKKEHKTGLAEKKKEDR